MKTQRIVLLMLLVAGMSLPLVVAAQAQHFPVSAALEEVVNQPASLQWRGTNLFVQDAYTVIALSGDWVGTSEGICNGVFHYGENPITGNLHCTLTFIGSVLGREGSVTQVVNGTFQMAQVPEWTGQIALSNGTGALSSLAANNLFYTQTGLFGTLEGSVVFAPG